MSGGAFDYKQTHIQDILEVLKARLGADDAAFSDKTRHEFRIGLSLLHLAFIYAHEIDLLLSDDTGEDTFHERLPQKISCIDLTDLKNRLRRIDTAAPDQKNRRGIRQEMDQCDAET